MVSAREPLLHTVPIRDLRPTQITVGMREVEAKRKLWHAEHPEEAAKFLGRHMIPVILGPADRNYIVDHHHLALALHLEGVDAVLVDVIANLSRLPRAAFWFFLENRGWTHPYDAKGARRPFGDIPKTVDGLTDDPYRSLAGALRRAGGFAKETTPFCEFLWADFLRRRLKGKLVAKSFDRAVKQALTLARSDDASYLPGWCGPDPI